MAKAWNAIIWTDEMINFLKLNYDSMTNPQLAAHLGLKVTAVRMKCYELGLYKMRLQYWTDEQVQFLKDHYQTKGDTELAEIFSEKWEKEKGWSKKHIEKKRRYLKLKRTEEQRHAIRINHQLNGVYAEGNRRMWQTRGCRKIGDRAFWKGQSYTKTANGYIHTRVYEWRKHYGEVPEGKMVCHKDGDQRNCEIDNLILLTREENAIKSSSAVFTEEHLTTLVLLSRMNRKIKQLQKTRNGKKQVTGS